MLKYAREAEAMKLTVFFELRFWKTVPFSEQTDIFSRQMEAIVEEKVVVIHRGGCNNKVYYRLSHDVVTWDVDRDVSTAYC